MSLAVFRLALAGKVRLMIDETPADLLTLDLELPGLLVIRQTPERRISRELLAELTKVVHDAGLASAAIVVDEGIDLELVRLEEVLS